MSGALPSWARVGEKVVCRVAKVLPISEVRQSPLVVGETYVITAAFYHRRTGYPVVYVEPFGNSISFLVWRFRPLASTKNRSEDVAMFRDLIRQPEHA